MVFPGSAVAPHSLQRGTVLSSGIGAGAVFTGAGAGADSLGRMAPHLAQKPNFSGLTLPQAHLHTGFLAAAALAAMEALSSGRPWPHFGQNLVAAGFAEPQLQFHTALLPMLTIPPLTFPMTMLPD